MTSWADATAARARHMALEQRAGLFHALWADIQADGRVTRRSLPARLLARRVFTAEPLEIYAADLILCDDDVWRVMRDDIGRHPAAAVLRAPLLAAFLPTICRLLLGQTLLLPSMPILWLGDPAALRILARDAGRFWLRDAFRADEGSAHQAETQSGKTALAELSIADRVRLQSMVQHDPGQFVAGRDGAATAPMRRVIYDTSCSGSA